MKNLIILSLLLSASAFSQPNPAKLARNSVIKGIRSEAKARFGKCHRILNEDVEFSNCSGGHCDFKLTFYCKDPSDNMCEEQFDVTGASFESEVTVSNVSQSTGCQ